MLLVIPLFSPSRDGERRTGKTSSPSFLSSWDNAASRISPDASTISVSEEKLILHPGVLWWGLEWVEAQDGPYGTKQHPPLFEEGVGDTAEWDLHLLGSGWHSAWFTERADTSWCQERNGHLLARKEMWGGKLEERGKEEGMMVNHACQRDWIWDQIRDKLLGTQVRGFLEWVI